MAHRGQAIYEQLKWSSEVELHNITDNLIVRIGKSTCNKNNGMGTTRSKSS